MGPTAVGNQCSNLGQKIKSITIKFKYITISSHKKKYKKMGAEVVTYVTDTNYGHWNKQYLLTWYTPQAPTTAASVQTAAVASSGIHVCMATLFVELS